MQKCAGHFHPLFCSYVIPHTELRCFLLLRLIARSKKIVPMSKAFVREWLITICTQFAGNVSLHSQESRRSQKPTNRRTCSPSRRRTKSISDLLSPFLSFAAAFILTRPFFSLRCAALPPPPFYFHPLLFYLLLFFVLVFLALPRSKKARATQDREGKKREGGGKRKERKYV